MKKQYRLLFYFTQLFVLFLFLVSATDSKFFDVLIIGDSISLGYTPFVKENLKDVAFVVHSPGNSGASDFGLKNIDKWLEPKKWDVIYFNFGMWDFCYRHPESKEQGNRDKVNGRLTSTPKKYGNNLRAIVQKMKTTGAKIIFATSTMVPPFEAGRFEKDPDLYNQVAIEVMKEEGIAVDDLYTLSQTIHPENGMGEKDVHYDEEGYKKFGEHVSKTILDALN